MKKSHWKTVKLEDVAEIQTGISKSASRKLNSPTEVPYLRVANVQDGHLDLSIIKNILIEHTKLDRYKLRKGDVLLTEGGDFDKLGRGTVWNNEIATCVHQNHVFCVRPDKKILLPDFLNALTSSRYGKRYFIGCSKQSTNLASINSSQLKKFPVLLPSIETQNSIVLLLSIWNKAIEINEELIAAKIKQFNWLSNKLFTPIATWKSYKLGDLFINRRETNNIDLPLISITREKGVIPHSETNRKDNSNKDKSKYLRICPNDIGYNTMRMWQGVSALSTIDGVVSPAYTICTPVDTIDPEFMAFLFKTKPMIHKFYRYSQGLTSDTWNLKFHHFSEVETSIPDLQTQVNIARVLNTAKKEISTLKQIRNEYSFQKQGLMQKLLTGEWHAPSQAKEETLKEVDA